MADYAIVNSGGHVNAYFVTSNEVQPAAGIAKAFKDELAARCPDTCKAEVVNIPISDWATKVPTQVQTALLKDPSINYVVPVFDGMTPFLITGITQAGKTGSVKIVAYNGTASVHEDDPGQEPRRRRGGRAPRVARLGEHGPGPPRPGRRGAAGQREDAAAASSTRSNVDEAGKPVNQKDGYGDPNQFKDGYRTLWGLK